MEFDHIAQQVPDIAAAVEWQLRTVPGSRVLHQDATWALVESGGAKLAFVLPDQQAETSHVARRLGHKDQFEQAGLRSAKPRLVYSSRRGRRSK